MKELLKHHFEAIFLAYLWMNASLLAVLVGRPWLGAIGLATVLPFLLLFTRGTRRTAGREPKR